MRYTISVPDEKTPNNNSNCTGTDVGSKRGLNTYIVGSAVSPVENSIDSGNSTTTPLGISGVFTGVGVDVTNYASVSIHIFADQSSAADGMSFQFSTNNTNWDDQNNFNIDITASNTRRFQFPVTANYFRFAYTNGGTAQSAFRVQTILHTTNILTSIHRIDKSLANDRSVTVTKSVISGETTAGGGGFVNVKVNPSGTLEVNASQDVHDSLVCNANIQVGDTDVGGANPVPISAAAMPLPTGAATEAKQDTGNTSLGNIDTSITTCDTDDVRQTTHDNLNANANMQIANSDVGGLNKVPVEMSSSPLPTGAATAAAQATMETEIEEASEFYPYLKIEDKETSLLTYVGLNKDNDAATSDATWQIRRVGMVVPIETTEYANDGAFDRVWDDRATYFTAMTTTSPIIEVITAFQLDGTNGSKISTNFNMTTYNHLGIMMDIVSFGSPTDVTITVQADRGGGNWFNFREWQWTDYRFSDAQAGNGIEEMGRITNFPFDTVRLRFQGQGTTGFDTFTISAWLTGKK